MSGRSGVPDRLRPLDCSADFCDVDVRCGIGSSGFKNAGNVLFRNLINLNKDVYQSTSDTKVKKQIVMSIIAAIKCQSPPGRFLEKNIASGTWYVVCDKRAIAKTSQALRERTRPQKLQRMKESRCDRVKELLESNSTGDTDVECSDQLKLKSQGGSKLHSSRITGLDITAIFDVDASLVGQFSDRDVEEWIKSVFVSEQDLRTDGVDSTLNIPTHGCFATLSNDAAPNHLCASTTAEAARLMEKWTSFVPGFCGLGPKELSTPRKTHFHLQRDQRFL